MNCARLGAKVDIFDEVDEALRLQNEQVYTLGSRQAQHDPKRTVIERNKVHEDAITCMLAMVGADLVPIAGRLWMEVQCGGRCRVPFSAC